MKPVLDGARRLAYRAAGRARRRLSGEDGGFVLLETLIAISLITVIMAAIGVEYVTSTASIARQRSTQSAAQVADSTLEQIRALRPTDLITGRDSTSVATQFSRGNAIPSIQPLLQQMDQASDASATAGAGASATIPTCDPAPQGASGPAVCTQKPGNLAFTVSQFIGTCWLVSAGSSSNCVPIAQKTASSVGYLRVVVSVSWRDGSCTAGCYYVTSTLVNADADPTFKANQPPAAAPAINPPGDQNNDTGDAVNVQLALVTGSGVPGFTWAITSGTLPTGLTLNSSTGVISGVISGPTGVRSLTAQVTDGYGRTDTATFNWTIGSPPTITAPANQVSAINSSVSLQLTTACTNTPCRYTLNNPPAGLTVNNTGLITGVPTVSGTSTMSVTIIDAANRTVTSNSFTWTVLSSATSCPPSVTLPNGSFETPTVGAGAGSNIGNGSPGLVWRTNDANNQVEYWANGGNSTTQNGNTAITAKDGTQWVEVNGAGMDTLYQDLTTTPGQVLQWSLWHRARNVTGNVNAQDSIQVQMGSTTQPAAQVPSGATSATISDGASAWVQYTGTYTVPSGQTTTRFQVAAVAVSGTSPAAGNFLDAVSVTGVPCLSSILAAQSSTVNAAINPVQLTASQGSGNYTWSGGSTLPAGLTISSSGLITGTPTTAGSTRVQLVLTDQLSGYQQSVSFTWTVYGAPTVTAPPNQTTTLGTAVNLAVSSSCPNPACTYTLANAPTGLSINSMNGTITGTPSAVGTFNPTVTVRDASGATATSASFTWIVKTSSTITSPGNQSTTSGVAVSLQLTTTCNYAPCTYSLSGQPANLSISNSGLITGTPSTTGTSSSVTATVTDGAGAATTTAPFSWTIYARPTITTPSSETDTVNTALILPITSTCPNAPCSYVLSGAPTGVSINSATGRISGTPTATGTSSSVKVTMTDAGGVAVSTANFTWTIVAAPSVTTPANQSTANNAAVSLTLTRSCPNSPCAYRLNGGPAGLSITSAGVVTGTVTSAPRTFSGVTITVTDSSGVTATSATFTWTVTAPLAGRWTFDESSGSTAADASGNGHPATLSGGYGKTATSVQGAKALTLNGTTGTDATVSGPVLNTASSFTVSAWAKLASTSDYSTFVAQSGTNVSGFYLQYNPNTNRFRFYKLGSDATSSAGVAQSSIAAPVIGQWYQLTGVYDSTAGTISLFVNGVRQGAPVAAPNAFNATGNFTIGASNFGGLGNWANGAIDDVRAYQSALSDDAVAQLAQAGYWRLDEGSGTTAQDSSLNNNPGTLSGGTSWTSGLSGPAVQFNGTSGVITSGSTVLDTSQSFSVSAWAKADSTNSTGAVISADGANISSFILRQNNNQWALVSVSADTTGPTVTNVYSSSNLVIGQWYQLTGVYDSVARTIALYVNGVLQGSPVSVPGSFKASGSLVIGRSLYQSATNYFAGAIDDVRTYRFPLDQAGVTALTNQVPPVPAAPTATAGATSATVSWTASANIAGSATTGYVVTPYLNGVAQTPVTYTSTATSQTVTGLTTGGSYTFSVAAVNADGTSATSPVSGSVLVT